MCLSRLDKENRHRARDQADADTRDEPADEHLREIEGRRLECSTDDHQKAPKEDQRTPACSISKHYSANTSKDGAHGEERENEPNDEGVSGLWIGLDAGLCV